MATADEIWDAAKLAALQLAADGVELKEIEYLRRNNPHELASVWRNLKQLCADASRGKFVRLESIVVGEGDRL